MFNRFIENEIFEVLDESPSLAITGARQVGKTTLAKYIGSNIGKKSHYIDLELPSDKAKLQDPVLYLNQFQEDCVIIDEVHHMPRLFSILRSLIDQNRRPGRFILLGSASPALMRDSSESLAGRIIYNRIYPLNHLEIEEEVSWKTRFLRGGFPNALLAGSEKASMRWRQSFIQTYLERELPSLGLNSDIPVLRKLLILIAQSQGQMLNMQNLAVALGVSRPTVSRYLDFLEKSYIVQRIEPYYVNIKKRLVKSPKLYIADSGLFLSLLGIQSFEGILNSLQVGPAWEGNVINQVLSVLPMDCSLWFFRTHEGAEADIVITKNEVPLFCCEIKWTNAPKVSKGFRNVIEYLSTNENFIITPEADTYPVSEHINVTSLGAFMTFLSEKLYYNQ